MPLRGDRIHRYVNAFCPRCHDEQPDRPLAEVRRLSGWLAIRDDRVWLERGCPDHGLVRTLYDESPEILAYLEQWTAPTKRTCPTSRATSSRCPSAYLRGLPEMQTQHTCILLADITDHCNLRCPTCFAESSPALAAVAPLAPRCWRRIDTRLSRENGRIDVLMLSGGEPTLYPQLAELLDEVAARPVVRILVNTNGLRIAQRRRAARPARPSTASGSRSTCSTTASRPRRRRHHRGADLRRYKDRPSTGSRPAGIFTTLTMTAALGVNDDEIGAVLKRALDTPYVGGVTIQPQFGSGRSAPSTRSTGSPTPACSPGSRSRPAAW